MYDLLESIPGMMDSAFDALWGAEDSRQNATKRVELARKTYQAMIPLWNSLNAALDMNVTRQIPLEDDSEVQQALVQFQKAMQDVYLAFDLGKSYARMGLLEQWSYYLGKQLHRNIAAKSSLTKEIQYELEQFWDGFFGLVRTQDAAAAQPLTRIDMAREYLADVSADGIRIGQEEMYQERASAASSVMYASTATEVESRYLGLLSRKIGVQIIRNEPMTIAKRVVDAITPKIMLSISEWMSKNLTGQDILQSYPAARSLTRMYYLHEFRDNIDRLVQLDSDYRLLMGLDPIRHCGMEDFVIMERFSPSKDLTAERENLSNQFDPESWKGRNSAVLAQLSNRCGGIPFWGTSEKMYRDRAADVFMRRITHHVAIYEVMVEEFSQESRNVDALIMERLKSIISMKECLEFEYTFRGWANLRLLYNLDVHAALDVENLAFYTADFLARDVVDEVQFHFAKELADEFVHGITFFADLSAARSNDVSLKLLLAQVDAVVQQWWPWKGESTEDAQQYVPNPSLSFDDKMHLYDARQNPQSAISTAVATLKDLLEEITMVIPPYLQTGTSDLPTTWLVKTLNVDPAAWAAETVRTYGNQTAISLAFEWAKYFQAKAIDSIMTLEAPSRIFDNMEERKEFATGALVYLSFLVHDTIRNGDNRVLGVNDFGGLLTASDFENFPPAVEDFIYYQNIALNLQAMSMDKVAFDAQRMDDLQGFLELILHEQLKTELPNQFKRMNPDFKISEAFDHMLQYDPNSFNGLMAGFMRNVIDVFNRRNLMLS